jgi:hypothetical protein
MKFKELEFEKQHHGGFGATIEFKEGFTLSVQCGEFVYCTPRENLNSPTEYSSFEIAIIDPEGRFITDLFIKEHHEEVAGWQSREDIDDIFALLS